VSTKKCLSGTGIKHSDLNDAASIVTGEQELRVIRNIVRLCFPVSIVWDYAGQRYHFTTFGMLGFAMVSSQNLRIALDTATLLQSYFCILSVFR
jgi:hypothetical protein